MHDATPLSDDELARARELFQQHGYVGSLRVIDDSGDEAIFLVPAEAMPTIRKVELVGALQHLLRRKVWVADREWSNEVRAV